MKKEEQMWSVRPSLCPIHRTLMMVVVGLVIGQTLARSLNYPAIDSLPRSSRVCAPGVKPMYKKSTQVCVVS